MVDYVTTGRQQSRRKEKGAGVADVKYFVRAEEHFAGVRENQEIVEGKVYGRTRKLLRGKGRDGLCDLERYGREGAPHSRTVSLIRDSAPQCSQNVSGPQNCICNTENVHITDCRNSLACGEFQVRGKNLPVIEFPPVAGALTRSIDVNNISSQLRGINF